MALYQVLYWKDIPAQVKVFAETGRARSRQMPDRFQKEIDTRAMEDGLFGTDDYLEQWQWTERRERDLPVEELLDAVVRELEQEHATRS